jgi:hypothetical protein
MTIRSILPRMNIFLSIFYFYNLFIARREIKSYKLF